MKRMVKKLTAAFLTAAMTFVSLPQTAIAEPAPQEADILAAGDTGAYHDFEYEELEDGTLSITGYNGSDAKIVIPSEIDGKKVTVIGDNAFFDCDSLTKITIPDSVTVIEDYAFYNVDRITEITIPKNVKKIGPAAFGWSKNLTTIHVDENNTSYKEVDGVLFTKDGKTLVQFPYGKAGTSVIYPKDPNSPSRSYVIPDGVTTIGNSAFLAGDMTDVTIPDSVTVIEDEAFWSCYLKEITISRNVTKIGKGAFASNIYLNNIYVDKENTNYKDINGVVFSKDGSTLVQFPGGKSGSYTVPDGVTTIGARAFEYLSKLESVTLPEGLTTICDEAFYDCYPMETNLKINLPDSLTTIGAWAFAITNIDEVTIPENVVAIGEGAFSYCNYLSYISVDKDNKNYKDINGVLFTKDGTILKQFPSAKTTVSYTVPDGVTTIETDAFVWCQSLTEVTLPESLTTIEGLAFNYCSSLTKITIPASVTEIGDDAFEDCSDDLTLYGYSNSYAETYAKEYEIPFISIGLFLNCESDVSVTADKGVIPDNTQLNVEQTEQTVTSLSYNITLTQNGKEIQPEGDVTVRIPVPSGWGGEEVYVYRKEADGSLTDMNAVVSGIYISFTTDHFSEYVVSTKNLTSVLLGDVDGDGIITVKDCVLIARYYSHWDVDIITEAADVDGDGAITLRDAIEVARIYSGWNEG